MPGWRAAFYSTAPELYIIVRLRSFERDFRRVNPDSSRLCAVRGATTAEDDSPEAIEAAVKELLEHLIGSNGIEEPDVVNVLMTVTGDIHSASPPRISRILLDWQSTPFFCSVEPDIQGYPPFCIRYLIQFYSSKPKTEIRPAYLRGAAALRPDWKA